MPDRESQTQTIGRLPPLATGGGGKAFGAVAYTLFILLTGTNLPTPLYRGYERAFGYSALVTTLIFAVYVAVLVPALLVAGPLSDAMGRRRVLLPSLVLAIAGSLAFAFASSTAWLFAARILQGLAVGAASGALTAALSEFEPTGNRHRAALVATAVSLGGLGAGPLIAGMLAQYEPAPYVVPFALEIILLIPAMIFVIALPEKAARTKWRPRRPSIPPTMRHAFAASGSANFLAFSVIGLFLSLVPAYVMKLSATSNLAIAGGTVTL
ncbi:MFS transporter [Acidiphilium multivorum]|uniref:MFS transporter n=1 Tax=Acidiphilium multivorum TaxID=62140 RepID=UPI001F4C00E9|nr:MFS transporter [Acidiphilium multivorum]UNC15930.1 MFS transporter [Acidiphilium multivorum]